ncbi:MAG: hypothetical protein JNL04_12900 [Rhodospirillaceae bacterium]|nr:hypothetical protein [Rhodospirillaceae bacterium]
MPIAGNSLVLQSEDEAWALLQELIAKKPGWAATIKTVTVTDWPEPLLYLQNLPVKGAITLPIMESLGDFQRAVWRGYSQSIFGAKDIRRVPHEKRKKLLLNFVVKDGSTTVSANPTEFIQTVASEAVKAMTGEQVLIFLIATVVLYFGTTAFTHFRTAREETERRKVEADQAKFMSAQETERARILAEAVRQVPRVAPIEQTAGRGMMALTRAAAASGGATVLGSPLDVDTAEKILSEPKPEGEGRKIEGIFTVDTIDAKVQEGHRFEFRAAKSDETIDAEVIPVQVTEAEINLLWEASRKKFSVRVSINAWEVAGKIERAFVMKVEKV